MRPAGAALVVVVLFALAALDLSVLRNPRYTPDGVVYARYAARDAGESERDATLSVRAFYEKSPMISQPRFRALVELEPRVAFSASRIFINRVLYPRIVALLLPFAGFNGLFIVSAVSYVLFGVALFWLLTALGAPWSAAVVTILVLVLPITRSLGESDLTDMLAAVWWTGALAALVRLMREQTTSMLVTLAVLSVLLTLTRPAPYLVVIPALAVGALRGMWLPALASCAGIVTIGIVTALTHAYGVVDQLRWVYKHEPPASWLSYSKSVPKTLTFEAWYRNALSVTFRYTMLQAIRTVLPMVLILVALYAAMRMRHRDEMLVLLAALLACLVAIPFNPVPAALARVVLFPMLPVFAAIAQCFLCTLTRETFQRRAQYDVPA